MITLELAGWTELTGAWLVNYLIHSTLLLGLAWLTAAWLARRPYLALGRRAPALEEGMWKAAVFAPLATATAQLVLAAPAPAAGNTAAAAATPLAAPASELAAAALPAAEAGHGFSSFTLSALTSPGFAAATTACLLALWAAGAAFLLLRLTGGYVVFRRRLAGRKPLVQGPLPTMLARLTDRARVARPVRLFLAHRIPVPFARGLTRPEICMPERAVAHLPEDAQEGILAHEVAHIARRDPAWSLALSAMQALFFFQPLNRVARRRLLEVAEVRCDDWAARATGGGRKLARTLTEVAGWLAEIGASSATVPAPSMAGSRSSLVRRVERLLAGGPAPVRVSPAWSIPLVAVLALLVAAAPGISRAAAPPAPPKAMPAPAAAPAPDAPQASPAAPQPTALPAPEATPAAAAPVIPAAEGVPAASGAPALPPAPEAPAALPAQAGVLAVRVVVSFGGRPVARPRAARRRPPRRPGRPPKETTTRTARTPAWAGSWPSGCTGANASRRSSWPSACSGKASPGPWS